MQDPVGAAVADRVPKGVLGPGAALEGESNAARASAEHAEHHEGHPLQLRYALNPFDHRDLFLRGFKEWGRGLDARISGKRLPDARLLGLFTTGFKVRGETMTTASPPHRSQGTMPPSFHRPV